MVRYNISPETILCECCPKSKILVPKINYNICERRTGLIPKVLKPIIERRIEYKRLKKEHKGNGNKKEEEMYSGRSNVLKWVLVTCFGYTGYKNARFGRIECHEAINGYGREVMVQASEIAEMYGYELIHGIVDSLWLKPNGFEDHEKLVEHISRHTSLPLSIEGVYKWIVFPRNKGNTSGALNRYYGLFDNGELKIRGIELRRHDSPKIVRDMQNDALKILSTANNSEEFRENIPSVIETLKDYARILMNGDYPLEDLLLTKRVSKGLHEYEQ
jgi:DNA polymerase elongation subunit (family B)